MTPIFGDLSKSEIIFEIISPLALNVLYNAVGRLRDNILKRSIYTKSYFLVAEKSKSQLNRNGLLRSLSTTQSTAQRKKRPVYSFDERTILVAFILVIVTLLIITIAMFKLAGSIASLSDRLLTLEYLLERCATSQCLAVYENET